MSSYYLKNSRKYKRRRSLILTTTILGIIALGMAGYLYFNRDTDTGVDANSSLQAASTQSDSTVSNVSASATSEQSANSTANVSTSSGDQNGVETKDHGYLPKVGTVAKSGKMADLEKVISDYTKKLPGKYGVTFIDLATGEMVNVNDKIEYIAASTSKLPVNVLLYKEIEAGNVNLDEKLVYKQEDRETGTGTIIGSAYGTEYTVRETSKLCMTKSDNCGVNMLIRRLGLENIRNYIDQVGGQVHYGKTHRSSPYDMAQIAQELYKNYLNNEDLYGELLNNMENSDWHDRIDANLPKGIKVAHKIGNQVSTRNDVGIVFATHPYVLSIMSDNVNIDAATKSIAELSEKIYNFEEGYAGQTAK